MKKILRKALGYAILAHIIPLIFIIPWAHDGFDIPFYKVLLSAYLVDGIVIAGGFVLMLIVGVAIVLLED
jgi:hypothetical protein